MSQRKSVSFDPETTVMEAEGPSSKVHGLGDSDSAEQHSSGAAAAAGDEVSDMLDNLKLKKKKKKKKPVNTDDFEAQIKQAAQQDDEDAPAGKEETIEEGVDMWAHNATQAIPYNMLLTRFFDLLQTRNPDLGVGGAKSFKIPPPQCLREGSKKTCFANIAEISHRLKRNDEHVMSFLFAELGTSGSVDGSRRLVIKGRFQQKQIENVLRRYIVEYVTCRTCRSPDTTLSKGENRLYFVECNSCGSRRSVSAIKTGFSAQIGRRKRQVG